MMSPKNGRDRTPWTDIGLFLLISLCWTICGVSQLVKYLHNKAGIALLAGILCIAAILTGLRWLQSRHSKPIHWAWFAFFWLAMTGIFTILYPISQRHLLGPGSDGEDALRVATSQMLQLHFPYYLHTFLGNLITPLPGALLLAAPFLLLGRAGYQNPFWLAVFMFFCARYFRLRSTALAFLLVIVLAGAGVLDDFVVGYDYSSNVFYVCAAVFFFLRTYNEKGWKHILAGVFLGLVLSSRVVYVVIPPLVLAFLLQQGKGTRAALRSFALPIIVATTITIPVYLYDPAHFSPLHVASKLSFLPALYAKLLLFLLPSAALLIAFAGFYRRLSIPRLFLIAGIASAVILLPSGLIALSLHQSGIARESIDYTKAAAILVALWAFSRFENQPGVYQTAMDSVNNDRMPDSNQPNNPRLSQVSQSL